MERVIWNLQKHTRKARKAIGINELLPTAADEDNWLDDPAVFRKVFMRQAAMVVETQWEAQQLRKALPKDDEEVTEESTKLPLLWLEAMIHRAWNKAAPTEVSQGAVKWMLNTMKAGMVVIDGTKIADLLPPGEACH